MTLANRITQTSPKEVINNDSLMCDWIIENFSLSEATQRCPALWDDLIEEFNNDWIEAVENEAESMGLELDDEYNVIPTDDDPDVTDLDMAYDDGYNHAMSGMPSEASDYTEPGRKEYEQGYHDGWVEAQGE